MRIFSYRSDDSALVRHLQSIKEKEEGKVPKQKNPILYETKHQIAGKSTIGSRMKEGSLSIMNTSNYIRSPKNSIFFPKNRAKIKYQDRKKTKKDEINSASSSIKKQQSKQFFTVKGITTADQFKKTATRKRNNSVEIKLFDYKTHDFKQYSHIEKNQHHTFRIRRQFEEPEQKILRVCKVPIEVSKNRAKSAIPSATQRRRSATFRPGKDYFKKNKTENIQLDPWDIRQDDSQFHIVQYL